LYYTGLTKTVRVEGKDGKLRTLRLDREYNITLPVEVTAGGETWFTFR
jgi:hypothetical protein